MSPHPKLPIIFNPPQVSPKPRTVDPESLAPFCGKTKVPDKASVSYTMRGEENMSLLDLSALEQIVEVGQTRFIVEVSILQSSKFCCD